MNSLKQIKLLTCVLMLGFPLMVSCSAFNSSVSNDPAVKTQREHVENLRAEVRNAESNTKEAELREKAAKNRLKAAEAELKVLESEVKRRSNQ
ncbi:hypothetical protein [Rufibacter roseus]|uniref:Uncharacterized protein n=1 Tax=Rufibacter roseus TaxID=1567108 RepID=A0ABW2DM20_9BACT|nr:hypothetical protein [Rufibacter roseus]